MALAGNLLSLKFQAAQRVVTSQLRKNTLSSVKAHGPEALLAADHDDLGELLSALLEALDEGDAAAVFARLDLFWARLAMHIRAENLHLFPSINKEMDKQHVQGEGITSRFAKARQAIAELRSDHDFFMHQLAIAVKSMRQLGTAHHRVSNKLGEVRQIMTTINSRLEAHNKLEEELVYRLPQTLLDPAEQSALKDSICEELANLPPRFNADGRPL